MGGGAGEHPLRFFLEKNSSAYSFFFFFFVLWVKSPFKIHWVIRNLTKEMRKMLLLKISSVNVPELIIEPICSTDK